MTPSNDPDEVLHVTELDDAAVDGLLDGAVTSGEAPLGYADAASLFRAARGAPSEDELADRHGSTAALATAATVAPADELGERRRLRALSRTTKMVIVGAAAALTLGGVAAAATGHLPIPGRSDPPTTTVAPPGAGVGAERSGRTGSDRGGTGRHDATDTTSTTAPADGATTTAPALGDGTAAVTGSTPGSSGSSNAGGNGNGNSGTDNAGGNSNGNGSSGSSNAGGNGNGNSGTNNAGGNSNGNGKSGSSNAGGATPTLPPAAGGNGQGAANGQGQGASNGVGKAKKSATTTVP